MGTIKKRVLVVGAGMSGITAIKACREENIDVICFERSGELGGLWRYRDGSSEASVMKNTFCNTSKEMSAFSDFPPPAHFPTYLHHTMCLKYLELYAENFDLLGSISYYQEVLEIIPSEDYGTTGKWFVKVRNLRSDETREEIFDGVMVCTGHHGHPSTPTYPNMDLFTGQTLHSSNYKSSSGMENLRVLVVGAGNSGCDIAAELANVAKKVYLSTRRGAWIYPRLFKKGKPMDVTLTRRCNMLLPPTYFAKKVEKTLNKKMDHKRFGIKPYHPVTSQHPTISDEIQYRLLTGAVIAKKDVKEFFQNGVLFDGDEEVTPIDAVIFATGFYIKFPFLTEDILRVGKNNKILLYKNMFPPQLKHHSLAVIGLIQPSGSLFPVAELQSRCFAALLAGKCRLPSTEKMLASVRATEGFRARNYVQSSRHSVEAPYMAYMDDVAGMFGVKPNLAAFLLRDPKLLKACVFGPCLPYQYRLNGPHKWEGARDAILNYKKRMFDHLKNERN